MIPMYLSVRHACVCVNVCIRCTCMNVHVCACMYVRMCMYLMDCGSVWAYKHICMSTCMHVSMQGVYARMCIVGVIHTCSTCDITMKHVYMCMYMTYACVSIVCV